MIKEMLSTLDEQFKGQPKKELMEAVTIYTVTTMKITPSALKELEPSFSPYLNDNSDENLPDEETFSYLAIKGFFICRNINLITTNSENAIQAFLNCNKDIFKEFHQLRDQMIQYVTDDHINALAKNTPQNCVGSLVKNIRLAFGEHSNFVKKLSFAFNNNRLDSSRLFPPKPKHPPKKDSYPTPIPQETMAP